MRSTRTRTDKASDRTPRPAILYRRTLPLVLAALMTPAAARAQAGADVSGTTDEPTATAVPDPQSPAAAAAASTPAGPPPPHTGVKATLRAIPGDFAHLPSRHSAAVIAGGAALALAAHPFDKDLNAHLGGSSTAKAFFAPGKFIGQGATLVGTSFAVWGIGRATDNRTLSHLGMDLLRATVEDAAIVYAIKVTARRDRPTGECCSFPSGHASVTFAAASVLWRHLGWKAAVPTYTVASYVALSRLHDNRHYLSDVVFGSAVGVVVGHTVTMHTRHGHENWAIAPLPLPGGGMGVMVSLN
jgi:PAP2 superfamily